MFNSYLARFTLIGLAAIAASTSALATPTCLDNDNLVCITETNDADLTLEKGEDVSRYSITNNSDTQIFAFAITNSNPVEAFLEDGFTGWDKKTLSVNSWDNGSYINFNSDTSSQTWLTGTNGNGNTALDSFEALFGSTSAGDGSQLNANFYWNRYNGNALTTGVTLDSFLFFGVPESNFVAFDQNGNIITSSISNANINVAAVPEPQTYLMFVIGLGVLSLVRRRA